MQAKPAYDAYIMQSYAKKRNIQAKVLTFVELDVFLQRGPIKCVPYFCTRKRSGGPLEEPKAPFDASCQPAFDLLFQCLGLPFRCASSLLLSHPQASAGQLLSPRFYLIFLYTCARASLCAWSACAYRTQAILSSFFHTYKDLGEKFFDASLFF